MICKNCGNEIAEGNQFCENCGAAVEVEEVVAAEAEIVTEAAPEVTTDPGKTFGIVALICGIAGLVLMCIPCLNWVSFLPAAAGIVFGIIGGKQSKAAGFKNTLATVGLILGIVYFGLMALALVFYLVYMLIMIIANASMYY